MQYHAKADRGGYDRYLPSQYEAEPLSHVDGREGFGSRLKGLGERENLVAEVIVLAKASLPYEIYRMPCLPLIIYRSMT